MTPAPATRTSERWWASTVTSPKGSSRCVSTGGPSSCPSPSWSSAVARERSTSASITPRSLSIAGKRRDHLARGGRANPETEPSLAQDVATHLSAVRLGDADAIVAGFESAGSLRDGTGKSYSREGGQMHDFYISLLQNAHGANDWVPIVRRTADDGRTCSIEYEIEKLRGGETAPKEGLMVFERGDSALFHSVRIYDEGP